MNKPATLDTATARPAQDYPRFSVWLLECRFTSGKVYISRPFTHNAGVSESEAQARAAYLEADARYPNGAFRANCTVTRIADDRSHADAMLVYGEQPNFRRRNWGGFDHVPGRIARDFPEAGDPEPDWHPVSMGVQS